VSLVKYELGFYIPEDGILHSHRRNTSDLTSTAICYLQRGFNQNVRMAASAVTLLLRFISRRQQPE
jgi:hypothetical protein